MTCSRIVGREEWGTVVKPGPIYMFGRWSVHTAKQYLRIQHISFPAATAATYSASIVDNVTIGCSLLDQQTAPDPIFTKYPVVDFPLSLLPPWSASLNVMKRSLTVGSGR